MQQDYDFQELSDQAILDRFKQQDRWLLEDIILLTFGYEYEGVSCNVTSSNSFPARQYNTALQATNTIKTTHFLEFVDKEYPKPDYVRCYVKKGPFIKWANKQWGDTEPKVRKTYNLWRKYKLKTSSVGPASESPQAKVKNCADKIQIAQFLGHVQKYPNKPYKANIMQIAKQVKAELTSVELKISTCKRYCERMSQTELAKHLKN